MKSREEAESSLSVVSLLDTNQRLNRRAQAAESEAMYWRRRYEAIQHPFEEACKRVDGIYLCLKDLHDKEWSKKWIAAANKRWWRF